MAESFVPGSELTLIWTREGAPFVASATLKAVQNGDEPVISLAPGIKGEKAPRVGERVVLCFEAPEQFKVTAKVASSEGGTLFMKAGGFKHRSRRAYPRINTMLGLEFRMLKSGGADLPPLQVEAMEAWSHPLESTVNFAVSGLGFMSPLPFPNGATLGLRLTLLEDGAPVSDGSVLEAEGVVVRSVPIDEGEYKDFEDEELKEGAVLLGHHIALQFVNLTPALEEALTQFTLHEQEIALGIDGDEPEAKALGVD